MQQVFGYLRFGIRQLRKSPGSSMAAVLTLALGIGATTAIFSLVHAVLLKPLPFPEPNRLLSIRQEDNSTSALVADSLSYPDYFDWRAQNQTFSGMASYSGANLTLTGRGVAQQLNGQTVSSNFFHVLGVAPMLGREFHWEEERAGNRAAMLSYGLWQSRFGGEPAVVGRDITLNGELYTIAGVMPRSFNFPIEQSAVDVWTSIAPDAEGAEPAIAQRGFDVLGVIGRLKPGVTQQAARADLSVIARHLAAQYPASNKWYVSAVLTPELEHLVGGTRAGLQVLFGAVALVLLIACVNVAGLLLARGARRSGEIALRGALGASRAEIVWQMLVESLLLSAIGGGLGVALAAGLLKGLVQFVPQSLPRLNEVSLDGGVLAFAIGLSVLTGLLFGVLPAVRISRLEPALSLRGGMRSVLGERSQHRLQTWLVIGETALGMVLLVGAGLLIRSFVSVLQVDPGFDSRGVLTAHISLPETGNAHDRKIQIVEQLMPRLAALPGVQSVSAGWPMPMSDSRAHISFSLEGHPVADADRPEELVGLALPGYFKTMRIPLIAGRAFGVLDGPKAAPVAIVNQAFAKKYFPGANPIGKHMTAALGDGVLKHPVREIVGVVGDIRQEGLADAADPQYYLPWEQAVITNPQLYLRATGDPAALERAVRATVAKLDPGVPIYKVHPLDYYVAQSAAQPRFQTVLLGSFAGMALLLAAVGLYGVLSYIVQQRAMEIALRLAVGARRGEVLQLILKRGMGLALVGIALGLGISLYVTRFVATLLYGVKPFDALTFGAVSLVLLLVALIASVAPAYRAAQTDPMQILRNQ